LIAHHFPHLEAQLTQWQTTGKVPPVLLITGASGIGKRDVAVWLARWLLCERTGFSKTAHSAEAENLDMFGGGSFSPAPLGSSREPCESCSACKKAQSGTWVDFTEIAPEETDSGAMGSIKIDQFRAMKSSMGFGAFDGAFRITLIREAERMTPQAANSLLKLLEEPPPGWIFLLTAADASLLLPTLVSRCQALRLRPLTHETLLALLDASDTPADRRKLAADLAQGSLTRALQMCGDEAWETRKALIKFIDEPAAEIGKLVDWAAADAKNFQLVLDMLEQVLSDLMRASVDPQGPVSTDGKKALAEHATRLQKRKGSLPAARRFWERQAERVFRARRESTAPLNKKLLMQDVLLPWLNP